MHGNSNIKFCLISCIHPKINIQSTFLTSPNLCISVSLTVLFGSICNRYTVFMQSDVCIYKHILHNTETLAGHKKVKK